MAENWDDTFASQLSGSVTSKHIQFKTLIEKKNHLFKSFMTNGRLNGDCVKLQKAGAELINVIKSS